MDFQVRKGLETPLKVHGMRTKFFCIYCIILAVIVLFVVGFLTSAMSGEGSFLAFIVSPDLVSMEDPTVSKIQYACAADIFIKRVFTGCLTDPYSI